MVCLGNICRSPLAEGILRHQLAISGIDCSVESAGTNGIHIGESPHKLSQKIAMIHRIDISKQKCTQFKATDINKFNKVYVMDNDNYTEVQRISGKLWNPQKVSLLLDLSFPGKNKEVPDPWYGKEKDYVEVFDLIQQACTILVERIRTQQAL